MTTAELLKPEYANSELHDETTVVQRIANILNGDNANNKLYAFKVELRRFGWDSGKIEGFIRQAAWTSKWNQVR